MNFRICVDEEPDSQGVLRHMIFLEGSGNFMKMKQLLQCDFSGMFTLKKYPTWGGKGEPKPKYFFDADKALRATKLYMLEAIATEVPFSERLKAIMDILIEEKSKELDSKIDIAKKKSNNAFKLQRFRWQHVNKHLNS